MTVPSLVIITTGPFDGVAWNVVVALMLFTTGLLLVKILQPHLLDLACI